MNQKTKTKKGICNYFFTYKKLTFNKKNIFQLQSKYKLFKFRVFSISMSSN